MARPINLSPIALDGLGQSPQIFHRVKLALPWKAKTRACVEVRYGSARRPLYHQARAPGRMPLLLQFAVVRLRRCEQITLQPLEIAFNLLGSDDAFNRVYGC